MRIKELDGVRGIAVLGVILLHYFSWLPTPALHHGAFANFLLMLATVILHLPRYGGIGLTLFFVLSGFLISTILLNLRDKENYFVVFYSRRALRIFPPYLLGMCVYIGISVAAGLPGTWSLWLQYIFYYTSLLSGQPAELHAVPAVLPYVVVGGLGVLWSLSVEEVYYTIWAPIVRFTSQKGLIVVLMAMIVGAPLMRYCLHTRVHAEFFTFYCQMDALAYGSAVALVVQARQRNPAKWLPTDKFFDWLYPILCLLFVLVNMLVSDTLNITYCVLNNVILDSAIASVIYHLIRNTGGNRFWVRAVRAKWLRSVGTVSYSLYLFHVFMLFNATLLVSRFIAERHARVILAHLLGLLFSFSLAYGLWYGLESRVLRLKDRITPRSSLARDASQVAAMRPVTEEN